MADEEKTVPCECCGGVAKMIGTRYQFHPGLTQEVYECLCGNTIEKTRG